MPQAFVGRWSERLAYEFAGIHTREALFALTVPQAAAGGLVLHQAGQSSAAKKQ
ncbi:MAG: hypothetical protein JWM41_4802 [Gemmatimonadetes bacterium]|nr:hypothetical protein [Gemmatimonadota bacterium]